VHYYYISGLSVSSQIPLHGLSPALHGVDMPDVTISCRAVPVKLREAKLVGSMCQISGDELLLSIPNLARFLIKDGREISFQLEPEGDAADISIVLVGTVFGALLHQRERIVLHASAVRVNGKAVLFCGSSGAGKSTLAAALSQRNYPLITDDLCAITLLDNGNPLVHPDGRLLKLWAQAIEKLDLHEKRGDRVGKDLDKFYVQPGQAYMRAVPLGTIYVLRQQQSGSGAVIETPNVVDRTVLLPHHAYRPIFIDQMEQQRVNYFRAATLIAKKAGMFYLTRALDFTAMPEVISALEQHWQDIGLNRAFDVQRENFDVQREN
jgi:hypothetical protein